LPGGCNGKASARTAEAASAVAVRQATRAPALRPPSRSRLPELDAVAVPILVVQGERDRFGMPPAGPRRAVAVVQADHALRSDLSAVGDAVRAWLSGLLDPTR
jgi:predicted alpha/beta-hydrolase family hydrolase